MTKSYKWFLIAMLSCAFFFHQADRALFGILTIPIQDELKLSDVQIGWINTVLSWTLAGMALIAGPVGDRFSRKWIITCSLMAWSLMTFMMGFVGDWRVFGQNHDAIMVIADAELTLGAVHAAAGHTAQLRLLDRKVARQRRAHHGRDDMVASIEVLRAADDLQRLRVSIGINIAGTHVDLGDPQMIGVGMRRLLEHLGGDDVLERIADLVDAFNTRHGNITHGHGDTLGNEDKVLQVQVIGSIVLIDLHLHLLLLADGTVDGDLDVAGVDSGIQCHSAARGCHN